MKKLVSIVVNYNSGTYLLKCVESLLASKLPDDLSHTICVVDNASTDKSLDSVKHLQTEVVSIISNDKNLGFSAANNQAFNRLASDYYACVNPDCQVGEETLSRVIRALEEDSTVAVASCVIYNSDGSVQKTCKRRFPTPGSALVRMFGLSRVDSGIFQDFDQGADGSLNTKMKGTVEYVEAISGAFFVMPKRSLQTIGLLDEGYFMHCEDLDYCMRARLAGYHVGFLDSTSVVHSKGESSKGARLRVLWYLHKGMGRFYKKFYQGKYPLIVTIFVYIGIGVRFLAKCCQSIIARLFQVRQPLNG